MWKVTDKGLQHIRSFSILRTTLNPRDHPMKDVLLSEIAFGGYPREAWFYSSDEMSNDLAFIAMDELIEEGLIEEK